MELCPVLLFHTKQTKSKSYLDYWELNCIHSCNPYAEHIKSQLNLPLKKWNLSSLAVLALNKLSHKLTIAIEVELCPILLSLTKQPSHKLTIVIDDE